MLQLIKNVKTIYWYTKLPHKMTLEETWSPTSYGTVQFFSTLYVTVFFVIGMCVCCQTIDPLQLYRNIFGY